MIDQREIRHGHLFCGIGSGAAGFNDAIPQVGPMVGKFRCIGGIDNDALAIDDFGRLTCTAGTVVDLFDYEQYLAFHGHMPPPGWREAGTMAIHKAFGFERPHIVFLSAPCKGFSGLLSETKSLTDKYQALNRLTLRGIWLTLEAYKDDPIELLLFENVPRIATRGRHLLDQITSMLRAYGYAVAETKHDCGEIGGLAQSRNRFLLVARHMEKVPAFLYQPDKKPLRAVGDVLGRMPLPGDPAGGPMHRIPALQWKTWVRLAFVEAGSDWRSLSKLAVEDGQLRDYLIVPNMQNGGLGVNRMEDSTGAITSRGLPTNGKFSVADPNKKLYSNGYGVMGWEETPGAVAGESLPSNGKFSVADPQFVQSTKWKDGQALGVHRWADHTGTIGGQQNPGQGAYSVADPQHTGAPKHSNEFRIVGWDRTAQTVSSAHGSGQAVSDPRGGVDAKKLHGKHHVTPYNGTARAVIAGSTSGEGAFAVADPKPNMARGKGDHYLTGGHYGVVRWDQTSYAVASAAGHDNGHWSLADPRDQGGPEQIIMPKPTDKLVCRIQALDGTWHRPFTTLDLAGLQSLFDPDELWPADAQMAAEVSEYHRAHMFSMAGNSDQRWREGIGNAVPRAAAKAIAEVMGETLLGVWAGETFQLSAKPIWVRPLAIAISVDQPGYSV
ncbi:DNA cytosine methyltransferase [Polaromonas sp.]|uniref:DNA cytosine methyltransferase n=1 Tax=Polaromonas sp. TaxID=1869339 RepID=UPI003264E251